MLTNTTIVGIFNNINGQDKFHAQLNYWSIKKIYNLNTALMSSDFIFARKTCHFVGFVMHDSDILLTSSIFCSKYACKNV